MLVKQKKERENAKKILRYEISNNNNNYDTK